MAARPSTSMEVSPPAGAACGHRSSDAAYEEPDDQWKAAAFARWHGRM